MQDDIKNNPSEYYIIQIRRALIFILIIVVIANFKFLDYQMWDFNSDKSYNHHNEKKLSFEIKKLVNTVQLDLLRFKKNKTISDKLFKQIIDFTNNSSKINSNYDFDLLIFLNRFKYVNLESIYIQISKKDLPCLTNDELALVIFMGIIEKKVSSSGKLIIPLDNYERFAIASFLSIPSLNLKKFKYSISDNFTRKFYLTLGKDSTYSIMNKKINLRQKIIDQNEQLYKDKKVSINTSFAVIEINLILFFLLVPIVIAILHNNILKNLNIILQHNLDFDKIPWLLSTYIRDNFFGKCTGFTIITLIPFFTSVIAFKLLYSVEYRYIIPNNLNLYDYERSMSALQLVPTLFLFISFNAIWRFFKIIFLNDSNKNAFAKLDY